MGRGMPAIGLAFSIPVCPQLGRNTPVAWADCRACYGLVQYSRFSARSASGRPFCRRTAAETATNLHPTTLCLRSGVLDGAAASAGPIVPLPGVANGRPRLSAQVTLRRRTTRRAGMAERGGGYALSFGGIRLACALAQFLINI